MKISELIEKLQAKQAELGDVKVEARDYTGDIALVDSVETVSDFIGGEKVKRVWIEAL